MNSPYTVASGVTWDAAKVPAYTMAYYNAAAAEYARLRGVSVAPPPQLTVSFKLPAQIKK